MDNIKTKLQTQSIKSSCEKIECINQELSRQLNVVKAEFHNIDNLNSNKPKGNIDNSLSSNKNANITKECLETPEIKYKDILSTVKAIHQEHGFIKGFFRGLTPRIIANSPSCAISWGTYEIVKFFLHEQIYNRKKN